jgi:hypothetical protein
LGVFYYNTVFGKFGFVSGCGLAQTYYVGTYLLGEKTIDPTLRGRMPGLCDYQHSPSTLGLVEYAFDIDVRRWHRSNLLIANTTFQCVWRTNDGKTASLKGASRIRGKSAVGLPRADAWKSLGAVGQTGLDRLERLQIWRPASLVPLSRMPSKGGGIVFGWNQPALVLLPTMCRTQVR